MNTEEREWHNHVQSCSQSMENGVISLQGLNWIWWW